MQESSTAITANGLKKSFKKVQVLKDVSFTVKKGSVFALLGANGAGKTTTINILTTLLKADGGSAAVAGFNVATQAAKVRERISLTGQFAAVDDVLTGRENLVLMGDLRHVKNSAHTAKALLDQFELSDAADRRVGTYSGGMQRRLDIAMSLIGDPAIIFLDEPTTGLDPQSRLMMWQEIKDLSGKGVTIFLTTQYLEEADQLADKIAILNGGRIVAEGTPSELKKLLPQGEIELRFHHQNQLRAAAKVLALHKMISNDEALTITLSTDGSVTQLAHIFGQLQSSGVQVAEFSQKTPTLDDAFLKIISGEKK